MMLIKKVMERGLVIATAACMIGTTAIPAQAAATKTVTVESNQETGEWDNLLVVAVRSGSSLNVREEASADSTIVGKIYRGCVATVEEKGAVWTKISSGNVEGYVLNIYCLYGDSARKFALKNATVTKAVADISGLRVRKDDSSDAGIATLLAAGDSLNVVHSIDAEDGWVAVNYNGAAAYVSEDYVSIKTELSQAETLSEANARYQAALAASNSTSTTSSSTTASSSTSTASSSTSTASSSTSTASSSTSTASTDTSTASGSTGTSSSTAATTSSAASYSSSDLDSLAAIIYCEAGGETYEGQLAVGAVIMNRIKSSKYPNNLYDVLHESGQFTPVSSGSYDSALANGSATSSCYAAAQAALSGQDNTGGCLNFRAGQNSSRGLVIDHQTFF